MRISNILLACIRVFMYVSIISRLFSQHDFYPFLLNMQVSVVRSITMDSWKHSDILAMLEGGNKQLGDFFIRHGLPPTTESSDNVTPINRYKTNAAKFYKKNLSIHASQVRDNGAYKGRETSRQSPKKAKRRYVDSGVAAANGCPKECETVCAEA